MHARLRKYLVRVGLAVLLLILASVPISFPYLASLLRPATQQQFTPLDLSLAPEITIPPGVLFEYAGFAIQSVRGDNYTEAKRILSLIGRLPENIEHNLKTYLTLVQELVSILESLKTGIGQLQNMTADGAIDAARRKIGEIEPLINDASNRLKLLFYSLDQIHAIYRIDISRQRENLEALSNILLRFEQALAKLKTLVDSMDQRAPTKLDLRASPAPVWIDNELEITGQLESEGRGLDGRAVQLWVNGVRVANPNLDSEGKFTWKYFVSDSSHFDRIEAYARYVPVGNDSLKLRPTRSSVVVIPVEYYPVSLTLLVSTDRVHVLQDFTIRGQLNTSSGTPLAQRNIRLIIDGIPANTTQTNYTGSYSFVGAFPLGTSEGAHVLYVRFSPDRGIYASGQTGPIAVRVYYLKPTISLNETVRQALSGQTVQLNGRLGIGSAPFPNGLVVAVVGQRELGRGSSGANGEFTIPLSIPLELTGNNSLRVVFLPEKPWISPAAATVVLNVLNSVMVGLGFGAVALASLIILEKRPEVRSKRREGEPVTMPILERPEPEKEKVLPSLRLGDIRGIAEPRLCVREVYWQTRGVLAEVLHHKSIASETHREYEARIINELGPGAVSFSKLTHAFELAEYSSRPVSRSDADLAINYAVVALEGIDAEVKP